jgi:hypothetical protein
MARRTSTTHPDHGGRRRPTAAMVPHSQRQDIQQSANMLCDKSMSFKLERIYYLLLFINYLMARRIVNTLCDVVQNGFTACWNHKD